MTKKIFCFIPRQGSRFSGICFIWTHLHLQESVAKHSKFLAASSEELGKERTDGQSGRNSVTSKGKWAKNLMKLNGLFQSIPLLLQVFHYSHPTQIIDIKSQFTSNKNKSLPKSEILPQSQFLSTHLLIPM